MKPVKTALLTGTLSAMAMFSAFSQNKQDSLAVSDQLRPIDKLYSMTEPSERDGVISVSYDRWPSPHDTYEDHMTVKGIDGLHGPKNNILEQDEITAFSYIRNDKDGTTTVIKGKAAENGFDVVERTVGSTAEPVTSHVRKLSSLGPFRSVLPHME